MRRIERKDLGSLTSDVGVNFDDSSKYHSPTNEERPHDSDLSVEIGLEPPIQARSVLPQCKGLVITRRNMNFDGPLHGSSLPSSFLSLLFLPSEFSVQPALTFFGRGVMVLRVPFFSSFFPRRVDSSY